MSKNRIDLQKIKDFPSLIEYLREELNWPIESDEIEDITFDYTPEELGLKDKDAAKIKQIYQLRPMVRNQPWGIFWVEFEKKKLPVVVLRLILNHLVIKKRASANPADSARWKAQDLLFISAFGDEGTEQHEIAFAHFHQEEGDKPTLHVLGWDGSDTVLKVAHVAETLKLSLCWPDDENDYYTWREKWSSPFQYRVNFTIKTANALAEQLAGLAKRIRKAVNDMMELESDEGIYHKLHKAFQTALIHDLTPEDFADTFAQTITYGLLTAAITQSKMNNGNRITITTDTISGMVITNPFLREMLELFLKAGGSKDGIDFDQLGINDVVALLRSDKTDLPLILLDFNNRTRDEDPVIHFYEHFLDAYNKKLKIQRGVFYTPRPVVSYIVSSVHELLQTEFGLEDGLASTITWGEMATRNEGIKIPEGTDPDSPFVVILDPATGTATFLVEVIDVIYKTLIEKWENQNINDISGEWNKYVPKHLLPRLYGYELMMAPYAVAHMKIGLKLYETGYLSGSDERVRIYLTNALEPANDGSQQIINEYATVLAHEAIAVNKIKQQQRFTVVIGNPPYSLYSANMNSESRRHIDVYRYVEGQKIKERGALQLEKNLNDDYVKFFAFSEGLLSYSNLGILAFITNHGYLGNKCLRGMRDHLLNHFNNIHLMDLHGSTSRAKKDDEIDQNVFDIQQGVSIGMFSFSPIQNNKIVKHLSIKGTRSYKYDFLLTHSIANSPWQYILPQSEEFFFLPFNSDLRSEFELGYGISDIMPINSSGMVTARDAITIWFSKSDLIKFLNKFSTCNSEDVRSEFQLGEDTKDWSVERAQRDVRSVSWDNSICQVLYRPFDLRWTLWTGQARGFLCNPRRPTLQHMIKDDNVALITNRQVNNEFRHILVTRNLVDTCTLSSTTRETAYIFPFKIYDDGLELFNTNNYSNFSDNFLTLLINKLKLLRKSENELPSELTNDDILNYIYSIFHSPIYRIRYAEFLKIDFPRVPLTEILELFRKLSQIGGELVAIHLIESPKLDQHITKYIGISKTVAKVGYTDNTVWIDAGGSKGKNTKGSSGFHGVPEEVWNFHIGGYQVCEKWLKDRKGRTLTDDDINHYHRIVVALSETIRLMGEIDEVIEQYGGWPGAFCNGEGEKE